jgi:hypothetical protein
MATVRFAQSIQRHVECAPREVDGDTIGAVLHGYFRENERARDYVLDEQGRLRQHMAIFVDGLHIRDRKGLTDPIAADAVVDLIQALSGG